MEHSVITCDECGETLLDNWLPPKYMLKLSEQGVVENAIPVATGYMQMLGRDHHFCDGTCLLKWAKEYIY